MESNDPCDDAWLRLADARSRVVRNRILVAKLAELGGDTTAAQELLATMEETVDILHFYLDRRNGGLRH